MFKRFSPNYMALLLLFDIVVIQATLWLAIRLRYVLPIGQVIVPGWPFKWANFPFWWLQSIVAILWVISFLAFSLYSPRKILRWHEEFQRLIFAHTVSALSLAGALYFVNLLLPRLSFAYFYLLSLFCLFGYRAIIRYVHRIRRTLLKSFTRIIIVGAGKVGQELVIKMMLNQWAGIELVGFLDDDPEKFEEQLCGLPVLGKLDDAISIARRYKIDEVLIALPLRAHNRLTNLVAALYTLPIRVHIVPDFFEMALYGASVEVLGGIPLIGLRDPIIDDFQRLIKRVMDIILSGLGLVFLSPVFLCIALIIKLEDGGRIFYRSQRVGENGVLFRMIKFRSMVENADQLQKELVRIDNEGRLLHKTPDDPRVTKFGRFLRRTSLDELPQLINVLKGDMSLVGPRPELPWLVEKYDLWQRKRFAVPQGMTGWWQVNGRSEKILHLNTDQDIYYIQNYSLWLDVRILWKTVFAIVRGRGAF